MQHDIYNVHSYCPFDLHINFVKFHPLQQQETLFYNTLIVLANIFLANLIDEKWYFSVVLNLHFCECVWASFHLFNNHLYFLFGELFRLILCSFFYLATGFFLGFFVFFTCKSSLEIKNSSSLTITWVTFPGWSFEFTYGAFWWCICLFCVVEYIRVYGLCVMLRKVYLISRYFKNPIFYLSDC